MPVNMVNNTKTLFPNQPEEPHKAATNSYYYCRTSKNLSLQGCIYYILFVDDFTRMCWIFFLQVKSEIVGVSRNSRNYGKIKVVVRFML